MIVDDGGYGRYEFNKNSLYIYVYFLYLWTLSIFLIVYKRKCNFRVLNVYLHPIVYFLYLVFFLIV